MMRQGNVWAAFVVSVSVILTSSPAATQDSVVIVTGTPSTIISSPSLSSIEIRGTSGNGAYIGRTDLDGFFVQSAGYDGFQVNGAGDNGVEVTGATDYAGYFDGNIYVTGTCTGCATAVFGVNVEQKTLHTGDIVAVHGIRIVPELGDRPPLIDVMLAEDGAGAIGVVAGWAELDLGDVSEHPQGSAEPAPHLVPRSGEVNPGSFVTVIVSGLAEVRLEPGDATIEAGDRLVAGRSGAARALRKVQVDGVDLAEAAQRVGIALEAPRPAEDGSRVAWILVSPR
jgi:hypothetical protein